MSYMYVYSMVWYYSYPSSFLQLSPDIPLTSLLTSWPLFLNNDIIVNTHWVQLAFVLVLAETKSSYVVQAVFVLSLSASVSQIPGLWVDATTADTIIFMLFLGKKCKNKRIFFWEKRKSIWTLLTEIVGGNDFILAGPSWTRARLIWVFYWMRSPRIRTTNTNCSFSCGDPLFQSLQR